MAKSKDTAYLQGYIPSDQPIKLNTVSEVQSIPPYPDEEGVIFAGRAKRLLGPYKYSLIEQSRFYRHDATVDNTVHDLNTMVQGKKLYITTVILSLTAGSPNTLHIYDKVAGVYNDRFELEHVGTGVIQWDFQVPLQITSQLAWQSESAVTGVEVNFYGFIEG